MENNMDVGPSHSPEPEFSNEEIDVAHILVGLPSLICQSNLTRHIGAWGTKAKRSANKACSLTSASTSQGGKEVARASPMVRAAPRISSQFMSKTREDFEIFTAAMTLHGLKHASENPNQCSREPNPDEVLLIEEESRHGSEKLSNISQGSRRPSPDQKKLQQKGGLSNKPIKSNIHIF